MKYQRCFAVCALLCILVVAGCARVPPAEPLTYAGPGQQLELAANTWTTVCSAEMSCIAAFRTESKDGNAWLKAAIIHDGPDGMAMAFVLPPSPGVKKTVSVNHDRHVTGVLHFDRCGPAGCVVFWSVRQSEITMLLKSNTLQVLYEQKAAVATFNLPIAGIRQALEELRRRTSGTRA